MGHNNEMRAWLTIAITVLSAALATAGNGDVSFAVLGDVGAETRAVLTAIRDMLAEMGLDMSRIVRVDVHLADLDDFDAMDGAYREFFDPGAEPARTTTESRRLFGDSRVEITCQAHLS